MNVLSSASTFEHKLRACMCDYNLSETFQHHDFTARARGSIPGGNGVFTEPSLNDLAVDGT